MKRKTLITVLSVLSVVAMVVGGSSCESAFPNDKLDFYWRLDRIEYRDGVDFSGNPCQSVDIDNIMFGFARHMVLIEAPGLAQQHGVTTEFDDSIRLDYSVYNNPGLVSQLQKCGLDSIVSTFKLEFPDRKHMVLSGRKTILSFRKW